MCMSSTPASVAAAERAGRAGTGPRSLGGGDLAALDARGASDRMLVRLWGVMRKRLTHSKTNATYREFAEATLNFLRRREQNILRETTCYAKGSRAGCCLMDEGPRQEGFFRSAKAAAAHHGDDTSGASASPSLLWFVVFQSSALHYVLQRSGAGSGGIVPPEGVQFIWLRPVLPS
jgi:hypothetical protein